MLTTPYQAMTRTLFALIASCCLFIPNTEASETAGLDAAFRDETVKTIARMIEDGYVYPEMGHRLAEHLRQALRIGGYNDMETGEHLAGKLTQELRALSEDLHFRVVYSPPNPPPEANTAVPDEEPPEARRERRLALFHRDNFGFRSLQQKPGNVFYIKLDSFLDPAMAGDIAVAAMNFVTNAEAIIIDLRSNRGGDPRMVQLIASYFLKSPIQLTGLYWRSIDRINQSWTLPHVQGKRLLEIDLYILTSSSTFSAAEAFAYDMKTLGRAIIVGERTAGGANPVGKRQKVNDSFRIDLPIGRAVSPVTQANWEGAGVEPDIETPADKALARAHKMAVDRIVAEADSDWINEIAYEFLQTGEIGEAIDLFELNVSKHPNYANGYDSLGEAFVVADELDKAIVAYRKALELDPGLTSSAEALARLNSTSGKP